MRRNSGVPSSRRKTTPPADVSRCARARVMTRSGCRGANGGHAAVFGGPPFDELPHDRVGRVVDLLDRPLPAYASLIEHGDAGADGVRAAHVVGDHDTGDVQLLAHAYHELVDH